MHRGPRSKPVWGCGGGWWEGCGGDDNDDVDDGNMSMILVMVVISALIFAGGEIMNCNIIQKARKTHFYLMES